MKTGSAHTELTLEPKQMLVNLCDVLFYLPDIVFR
jgi:hypothetical protein